MGNRRLSDEDEWVALRRGHAGCGDAGGRGRLHNDGRGEQSAGLFPPDGPRYAERRQRLFDYLYRHHRHDGTGRRRADRRRSQQHRRDLRRRQRRPVGGPYRPVGWHPRCRFDQRVDQSRRTAEHGGTHLHGRRRIAVRQRLRLPDPERQPALSLYRWRREHFVRAADRRAGRLVAHDHRDLRQQRRIPRPVFRRCPGRDLCRRHQHGGEVQSVQHRLQRRVRRPRLPGRDR